MQNQNVNVNALKLKQRHPVFTANDGYCSKIYIFNQSINQ